MMSTSPPQIVPAKSARDFTTGGARRGAPPNIRNRPINDPAARI
jgi:hypothetical protein